MELDKEMLQSLKDKRDPIFRVVNDIDHLDLKKGELFSVLEVRGIDPKKEDGTYNISLVILKESGGKKEISAVALKDMVNKGDVTNPDYNKKQKE